VVLGGHGLEGRAEALAHLGEFATDLLELALLLLDRSFLRIGGYGSPSPEADWPPARVAPGEAEAYQRAAGSLQIGRTSR
jgi:hypothetical protein